MKRKFDPKKFQGKKRIYRPVPGATLIARVLVWDEEKKEYREPPRGNFYLARRVERPEGKRKIVAQAFETIDAARDWQRRLVADDESALAEASTLAAALVSQAESPCGNEPDKIVVGGPLFREVVEEWKHRTYSRLAKGTQLNYEKYLRLHFAEVMDIPIETITPTFIDCWIDEKKRLINQYGREDHRKSFEHELTLLSTILRYYIEYNDETKYLHPVKKRHREAVKVRREGVNKAAQDLTLEEFLRFREKLAQGSYGHSLAALATVQFFQALRISEAAALRWEDVVLDRREPHKSRLTVRQHVVYLRRRDMADYIEKGFKNASANEPVKEQPLFPGSYDALKSVFIVGGQGLIFRNSNGSFFTYRQIQAAYNRAFVRARLPYRGTHVLRHGGTRNVYNETGDLSIAQQILGNSDMETTLVYARRHKGALTKLAESHWGRERHLQREEIGNISSRLLHEASSNSS
jgi:integrase